jgi:NADH dehydrogenase FAD-containing subunit
MKMKRVLILGGGFGEAFAAVRGPETPVEHTVSATSAKH